MDYRGLDVSRVDGLRITQKFGATPSEVARARAGLVLTEKLDLIDRLIIHGIPEASEGHCDRDAALVVIAGNLALLEVVPPNCAVDRLVEAEATVASGLAALEAGAEEAARVYERQ